MIACEKKMPTFQGLTRVAKGSLMSSREGTATAWPGKNASCRDFCWEFWFPPFNAELVTLLCTSTYFLGIEPVPYCWWSFPTSDERNLPLAWLVGRTQMNSWKAVAQSCRIPWEGQWWKTDTHQEGAGDFFSSKVCERRAFSFIFLSKHRSFCGKMMQGNDRGWNPSLFFLCAFRSLKFACQTWNASRE